MSTSDPVVIAAYARTPMGGFQGVLSPVKATDLGAAAVRAAVERAGLKAEDADQIIMGCVLPGGLGQAPARQAALGAGLPISVAATTVNKMCGSGMQAAIMAHDALAAGSADVIIAGGMESMTNAPYLMTKHRGGARIGHDVISDSMYLDGLEDAYEPGKLMGAFAEETARTYQFTRGQMDDYAISSLSRARAAVEFGRLRPGNRPRRRHHPQGRRDGVIGRAAPQGRSRKDPDPEAGVCEGWRHHGGQCLIDIRRRGGSCHDEGLGG